MAFRWVLGRRVLTGISIGMVTMAVPARADVIAQSAQGFVSRNVVVVAASPAAVWKRLVTPSVWWSSDHTFSGDAANMSLDPVPGGCFCERLPGDPVRNAKGVMTRGPVRGGVEHMRVVYAERGKALRMVGALGPLQSEAVNATLTITLKDMDGGTRIIFEYIVGGYMRYPADKIQPAVDTVLSNQLLSLAHGFAPGSSSDAAQPEAAPSADAQPKGDAPAGQGLDKQGLLVRRGRIWSLPPSDSAPAAAPVALPPAPPTAPGASPLETAAIPPDVTPSGGDKPKPAKRGKAARHTPAPPPPDKPETPPKTDEPSTDAVNSVFDNAVGDPQRPVQPTPN